jgi:K+-sensing histidine kinase KdpD
VLVHGASNRQSEQTEHVEIGGLSGRQIGSWVRRYGIALLSVTVAFVSTRLLQPLFPYPFLFLFFGAVMASAWFGGTATGFFAVLVSTALVDYFFVPPFIPSRSAPPPRRISVHL